MRLLKPNWVSHDGKPIFSIDIHPDGSRFAVGGQGDECGKVSIWNMAPIKNEEDEMNENVPKLLCQMDNHLACVNCVRWSGNGKYLASGGDDNLIMIWQMARYLGAMPTFESGGGGKLNIEQWRCVHTLRQHSGDVLDLAWSPDDSFLASGSVDNTVTIWNAQKFPEVIQIIKGHTGLVKGVTWDPVGKYLASQSDDKTLRVWRTTDWQQETSVTEPFLECSGTTHVLRLSWSPDGHYVVSAHAMNNSGPVAKILERDGWKTKMDFVGHRKAITCVRFNPKLFVKKVNGDSTRLKQYSCCAIGCRDRSLSIWLTSLKRPLVVVHDLFNHSIMDVSWSQSGFELLVCSWDGSIAYANFTSEELGKAMSQEEKDKFHKQVYGISISSSRSKFTSSIIENPEMLKIQQRHIMKQQTLASTNKPDVPPPPLVPTGMPTKQQSSGAAVPGSSSSQLGFPGGSQSNSSPCKMNILEQQRETRTKDGRRRITPVLVAQMDVNDTPQPFGGSVQQITPSASQSLSNVLKESTELNKIRTTTQNMSPLDSRMSEKVPIINRPKPSEKAQDKIDTLTPKPTVASRPSPAVTTVTPPSPVATTTAVKRKADTQTSGTKRARKERESAKATATASTTRHSRDEHDADVNMTVVSSATRHTVCIPSPAPERTLSLEIGGGSEDDTVTIELENTLTSSASSVHVLKCISAGKASWEAMITSPGIALAGSRNIVCVACANKSLCVFSFSGRRLQPPLMLESCASVLQASGHHVLVVTSSGGVYVWDTKSSSVVVKNESVFPILPAGSDVTIARTSISERGYPVLTLSNQASYSFEPCVGAWIQLVRAEDPLLLNADYQASMFRQDPFCARGPLAQLQGHSTRLARQGGRMFRSNPSKQQTATMSHLENQLSVCLTLGSADEYHFWLLTYVRYLAQAGCESRLREICEDLLGPPHRSNVSDKRTGWNPKVLSFKRRDLLVEILPIIGTNIRLQRLFTEFKDQLDVVAR
ncbi:protein HIRA isoform X2 [Nematostella vectensis]|uniref:protein HIRA isoform X1 n=1 Tax=Nematostella vectensis TaxID=45351 RepID=UPI00138FF7EF|nr:protein HIRA isoform X1 [Nematostella vectensis]XP_048582114.1 protein HIRA isoform X2 [Nematostella vectensis]